MRLGMKFPIIDVLKKVLNCMRIRGLHRLGGSLVKRMVNHALKQINSTVCVLAQIVKSIWQVKQLLSY